MNRSLIACSIALALGTGNANAAIPLNGWWHDLDDRSDHNTIDRVFIPQNAYGYEVHGYKEPPWDRSYPGWENDIHEDWLYVYTGGHLVDDRWRLVSSDDPLYSHIKDNIKTVEVWVDDDSNSLSPTRMDEINNGRGETGCNYSVYANVCGERWGDKVFKNITEATVSLGPDGTYVIPIQSSKTLADEFYILDSDDRSVIEKPMAQSLGPIPAAKVTALLAASHILYEMTQLDTEVIVDNLIETKEITNTRITTEFNQALVGKVIVDTASMGVSIATGNFSQVVGNAVGIVQDAIDLGGTWVFDKYLYEMGNTVSDLARFDSTNLGHSQDTANTSLEYAAGGSGVVFHNLRDDSPEYNKPIVLADIATTYYNTAGEDYTTEDFLLDIGATVADSFFLGAGSSATTLYNSLDRNEKKALADEKYAQLADNFNGEFSNTSFDKNRMNAVCTGWIIGDCDGSYKEIITQGLQPEYRLIPGMGDHLYSEMEYSGSGLFEVINDNGNLHGKATAGSPVNMTAPVDTPSNPFLFSFDYEFQTPTGNLDVMLNGTTLASVNAQDNTVGEIMRKQISVTESSLLDLVDTELLLAFDGVTGSQIKFDNINMYGLDYQVNSVDPTSVPEPSTLWLLLPGLLGLAYRYRA